jgi:hypothetical protein
METIIPGVKDFYLDEAGDLYLPGRLRSKNSVWWREFHVSVASLAPGASGATLVEPDGNTVGGYNLDADGQHLTFSAHMHDDWDGVSDPVFEVEFENDMAAGAIGTNAIIKIDTYSKGAGEVAIKTQNLSSTVTVDDDARYTMYETMMNLDYDAGGGNDVDPEDVIGCHVWFDRGNSTNLTDIILNHITFRYKVKIPAAEV